MLSDPALAVPALAPDQTLFDRYTLLRPAADFGLGAVWLAHDRAGAREVELTILPPLAGRDADLLEALRRECHLGREHPHAGLPALLAVHADEQCVAVASEAVAGVTLEELRAGESGGVFETSELETWAGQLCAALDHAHRTGRVHGDVHPANLLRDERGQLRLLRLGLVRALSESVRLASAGARCGELAFKSPQQNFGDPSTPRDDLYAVGATLYALLTSKPPIYRGNLDRRIEQLTPPTLAARREEFSIAGQSIPAAWEETIAACLTKEPASRPGSAAEIAARLGCPMPPPADAPAPPPPPATPRARKRRWLPPDRAVLLAGLVSLLGVSWLTHQYFSRENAPAPEPTLEPKREPDAWLIPGLDTPPGPTHAVRPDEPAAARVVPSTSADATPPEVRMAFRTTTSPNLLPGSLETPSLSQRLGPEKLGRIGRRIWKNESGGTTEGLIAWNENEKFASLGIAHFIWFPRGAQEVFEESFPQMVAYLKKRGQPIPGWLEGPCPWATRADFLAASSNPEMKALRSLLLATISLQCEFVADRLERSFSRILDPLPVAEREAILIKFERLAGTEPGLFALIDYVNFKGDGTKLSERYQGIGWGLLQVLQAMPDGAPGGARDFGEAAAAVLTRRVQNAPPERHEESNLPGWKNRVRSYGAP